MSPVVVRLTLAAALFGAQVLAGAQLPPLVPGSRLRIHDYCEPPSLAQSCHTLIGELHSSLGDTLLLRDTSGHDHQLLLTSTTAIDVSDGTYGHALAGLGVGFLFGLGTGLALSESCRGSATGESNACGIWYLITVPTWALGGLITGVLIRTERWRPVQGPNTTLKLEPTLSPTGLALTARLQF